MPNETYGTIVKKYYISIQSVGLLRIWHLSVAWQVPHELMKNGIPTRPNRLLHDQGPVLWVIGLSKVKHV